MEDQIASVDWHLRFGVVGAASLAVRKRVSKVVQ